MMHETNIAPKNPSERLKEAKDNFRRLVLADEVSAAVLSEKLFDSNVNGADFPRVTVEPTLSRDETTISYVGLRIAHSNNLSEDELNISSSRYEYIDIGTMNREDGTARSSDELKGLLKSAGLKAEDAISLFQIWQRGASKLVEEMGDELTVDPHSNTFELTSIVERTVRVE